MLKLAGFVLMYALALSAQTVTPAVQLSSQAPLGARFEVLDGTPAGRLRLDRFTGKTWRMAENWENSQPASRWVELAYAGTAPAADSQPRYQITHGNANQESLVLTDTFTGQTWRYLYDTTTRKALWKPVEEPR